MNITDTLGSRPAEVPGGTVRIYLCGVTAYDDSHIGHARTVVVFDVLRRLLERSGRRVELVQNFTDIDDKIVERAAEEGSDHRALAEKYIASYHRDFDELGVGRAARYPRATEHIPQMISLIESLVSKGFAYARGGSVYFDVSKFPGYGRLSGKRAAELLAGARVEPDPAKRDPADFALWKKTGPPSWPSPWGEGRPGWHVECSAMGLRMESIQIHGGGRDLIFPHHENEIAQSEAHTGKEFARAWMHVGMVTVDGQKMSKSLGNSRTLRAVLDRWGPNAARVFCLSGHYSKPVDYSEGAMSEALSRWRQAEAAFHELRQAGSGRAPPVPGGFWEALEGDMGTHAALDSLLALCRSVNRAASAGTLGSSQELCAELDARLAVLGLRVRELSSQEASRVEGMLGERDRLRRASRYAEADALRAKIEGMGVELADHGGRTTAIPREIPLEARARLG